MQQPAVILWRRLESPGFDVARLATSNRERKIEGTAVFIEQGVPCRLDYAVECDERWQTRTATITGWNGVESVDVRLQVDDHQRWFLNGSECRNVEGCLDVDLSFTPATNTLPIRRLGLSVGSSAPVRAAWFRFPEFVVEPLDQEYHRFANSTYHYSSHGGTFNARLDVNGLGFVTNYEGLWEQVQA